MLADTSKWRAIAMGRRAGWDIRRFNPFAALDDYLSYILFPSLHVNCVLDVGAHVGEYALGLRHSGYQGRIVSFEPVTTSFEALRTRAAADTTWTTLNVALGRGSGSSVINVMKCTTFSSLREPVSAGVEDFVEFGNAIDHEEIVQPRLGRRAPIRVVDPAVVRRDSGLSDCGRHIRSTRVCDLVALSRRA